MVAVPVCVCDDEPGPSRKPWRIYKNDQDFTNYISRLKYDGSHRHAECGGKYMEEMALHTQEIGFHLLEALGYPRSPNSEDDKLISMPVKSVGENCPKNVVTKNVNSNFSAERLILGLAI